MNDHMKCSVCGKEYGNSSNCQYCGVDRVTGLGNYNGYNAPRDNYVDNRDTPYTEPEKSQFQTANNGSTVCYACGEIIPADSKFCPYCSKELLVKCPNCRHEYSSQYPICNKCGTNREDYYKREKEAENRQREYERQQRIEQDKKIEEERKLREWENSPEGQAELKKGRESARLIKKEICSGHSGYIIIGWICIVGTVLLFLRLIFLGESHQLVNGWDIVIPFIWEIVFGIWWLIALHIAKRKIGSKIQKWEQEHPNDIITRYHYLDYDYN